MASPSSTSNNSALSPVAASGTTTPGAGAPCAACKFLRRKCLPGCVFAPYFPPEEPQKFANVHKVFGASNVTKLLNELLPHQREDAVCSLAYEAEARVKDPVYGCVGAISVLQRQVHRLQKELDAAHAELLRYACGDVAAGIPTALPVSVSFSAAPRLSTAMTTTNPGHQFAASAATAHVAAGMYGSSRRLGVLDGAVAAPPPLPPAGGCYIMRNRSNVNSSLPGGAAWRPSCLALPWLIGPCMPSAPRPPPPLDQRALVGWITRKGETAACEVKEGRKRRRECDLLAPC